MQNKKSIPQTKWAQRKDKLFITFDVTDIKNPVIDIVDGRILKFHGDTKDHKYALEVELYDEVVKEESKYNLAARNILLDIKKKNTGPYWPRLLKESTKYNWLNIDWTHYVDEDEEDEQTNTPKWGEGNNFDFNDMPDEDDEIPVEESKDEAKKNDLDDLDANA